MKPYEPHAFQVIAIATIYGTQPLGSTASCNTCGLGPAHEIHDVAKWFEAWKQRTEAQR